ncbi:unnamed protein product [Auanema sp. JU1783]|nr:unnamed protein product [Auanema sp. JU1783]
MTFELCDCKISCKPEDAKDDAELGFYARWKNRNRVRPGKFDVIEARMAVGSSFVEHHLTIEQLCDVYPDSYIQHEYPEQSDGLHSEEARNRLRDGGANVIDPPKEPSVINMFLQQFHYKFWLLLTGAAFLSIATYCVHRVHGYNEPLNLYCAFILMIVVVFMCCLSYWQERKAKKVIQNFTKLLPSKAVVIRDCEEKEVDIETLVVGDLVVIRSGSRIPADLRILHTNCLTIEVGEVTGSNELVECTAEAAASYVSVFDAKNVAFKGSHCTEGDGIGIVIRTGKFTVLGGIANIHHDIPPPTGKLQRELRTFANFITILAISMAAGIFLIGCIVARFENILDHFVVGFLVIIVANVPQGLPATVMSQLRIIARRMAQKNILIKKLELIDELGAATVICADKSGTLTMNQMVVSDLWFNNRMVSGSSVDLKHPHLRAMRNSVAKGNERFEDPLPDILTVMSVCNRAQFENVRRSARRVSTMRALQKSVSEAMLSGPLKKKFTVVDTRTGQVSEPRRVTLNSDAASISSNMEEEVMRKKSTQMSEGLPKQACHKKNEIFGVPSDVALVKYVERNASVEAIRQRYHTVFEIPFNSIRRWQLVVARCLAEPHSEKDLPPLEKDECRYVVMIKGAPEVIFNRCDRYRANSVVKEIDGDFKQECQVAWESLGNQGRRVIAFAQCFFKGKINMKFGNDGGWPEKFVFLGMAAIMDPPRPETFDAIQQCKQAGIKVFMITGDHPTTAHALATQIGLIGQEPKVQNFLFKK